MAAMKSSSPSSLRKLILWIVVFSAGSVQSSRTCAIDRIWPEDEDTLSFIEPSITADPTFNQEYKYYSRPYGFGVAPSELYSRFDTSWHSDETTDNDEANILEWKEFLAQKKGVHASRFEIARFFYNDDRFMKNYAAWLGKGPELGRSVDLSAIPDIKAYSEFTTTVDQALSASEGQTHYDKKCHLWVTTDGHPETLLPPLIQRAQRLLDASEIDPFLRIKYAFQLTKLIGAWGKGGDAEIIFNRYVKPNPVHTLTYYRFLANLAGYRLSKNEKTKSLRAYLEVMEHCRPLRAVCILSLRNGFSRGDLTACGSELKDPHQQVSFHYALSLMDSRDFSLGNLASAAENGPQESQTAALLVRTIQIAEKSNMLFDRFHLLGLSAKIISKLNVWKNPYATSGRIDPDKYKGYIDLCERTSTKAGTREPALWSLAGSYFALLEGNNAKATELYWKSKRWNTNNKALQHQIHMIGTLIQLQKSSGAIGTALQTRIAEDLIWARTLQNYGNNPGLYHSLWLLLGQKYLCLGDTPRAVLCFASAGESYDVSLGGFDIMPYQWVNVSNFLLDVTATDDELVKIRALLQTPPPTPLVRSMVANSKLSPNDILILLAVRETRRFHYGKALDWVAQITPEYLKPRSAKSDYHYPPTLVYYKGSKVLLYKEFRFKRSFPDFGVELKTELSGFKDYLRLMKGLEDRLLTAKRGKSPQEAVLALEIGAIMSHQSLTGWPEVRRPNPAPDLHSYDPITVEKFPLGIPGITDGMAKACSDFILNTPDFHRRASDYCREAADSAMNRELAAKACVAQALLSADALNEVTPGSAEPYLKRLKKDFSATEFYKYYYSVCETLRGLDQPTP